MNGGTSKILEVLGKVYDYVKPYVVVFPWETGAKITCGKFHSALPPGYHFKWPIFDYVENITTAVTTLRGPVQTIGNRSVRYTCKYQVVDVEAFTVNIYDELSFLKDILTSHTADFVSRNPPDWRNFMRRTKWEASDGGFEIHKIRLVDDTSSTVSLRLFGDEEGGDE